MPGFMFFSVLDVFMTAFPFVCFSPAISQGCCTRWRFIVQAFVACVLRQPVPKRSHHRRRAKPYRPCRTVGAARQRDPGYRVLQWSELSHLTYITMGAMCEIYSAELDGVKVAVKIPRKDCEEPAVAEHDLEVGWIGWRPAMCPVIVWSVLDTLHVHVMMVGIRAEQGRERGVMTEHMSRSCGIRY